MKKKLMLLGFLVVSLNTFALDLWVKGGMSEGVGNKTMEDPGYIVGLELSQGVLGFVDVGVGVSYNGNLKFNGATGYENVKYDVVPVYAFAKVNIFPVVVKPYLVARIGGAFVANDNTKYYGFSKAEGGVYGAVGGGIEFLDSFQAELLYSIMEVRNNPSGKSNVEMVSLTIGYNFW